MIQEEEIRELVESHSDLWSKKAYKKGDLLSKAGRVATHNYYIESGIIKAFAVNEDILKEVIIGFPSAGEFVLACSSIDMQARMQLNLEVIEDAVIYSINADNWNELRKLKKVTNEIIMQCLVQTSEKFIRQSVINSYPRAKTRYQKSLENYPCISRIKDEDVASFLGFDVRTIRRIK